MAARQELLRPVSKDETALRSLMDQNIAGAYYWQAASDEHGQPEDGARPELAILFIGSSYLLSLFDPFFDGSSVTRPVINFSPIFRGRYITQIVTHPQERQSVELHFCGPKRSSAFIVAGDYKMTRLHKRRRR